jgi:hypothetical protein
MVKDVEGFRVKGAKECSLKELLGEKQYNDFKKNGLYN